MGCITSLPSVDASVSITGKCRQHILLIRSAMENRQKMSHAQAAYIESIRNTGIALEHFCDGIITIDVHSSNKSIVFPNTDLLKKTVSVISGFSFPNQNSINLNAGDPSPVSTPLSSLQGTSSLECWTPFSFPNVESTADILTSSLRDALAYEKEDSSSVYCSPVSDDKEMPASPSTDLIDSSWLSVDIFTPSYIPYHIQEDQEQTFKWVAWTDHIRKGYEERIQDELLPDLEELEDEACPVNDEIYNLEEDHRKMKSDFQETERMPNLKVTGLTENEAQCPDDKVCQDDWSNRIQEASFLDAEDVLMISQERAILPHSTVNDDNHTTHPEVETDDIPFPKVPKDVDIGNSKKEKDIFTAVNMTPRNLKETVTCLRKHFNEAHMSGECVSRILTSEFHHEKGSPMAINAMKSNWSNRTSPAMQSVFEKFKSNMARNQATTLQRLYAWEKKLYSEVKESEFIRMSFDYTYKQLNSFMAADANRMVLDRVKLTLKELDAQLFVFLKAIQTTSIKIQDIAHNELYSQLYELLIESKKMWKTMSECHNVQERLAFVIDAFEVEHTDKIDERDRDATLKLEHELNEWQSHLICWHQFEKKYIDDLYAWIELCYETNHVETINREESRGTRTQILWLLKEWKNGLLCRDVCQNKVVNNIMNFASAIHSLEQIRLHKLKFKTQTEMSSRKSNKHRNSFENQGTSSRWSTAGTAIIELEKMDNLNLLKQHLPGLFKSMSTFAEVSWRMYEDIQQRAESQSVTIKDEVNM